MGITQYNKAIVAAIGIAVTLGLIDEGTGQDIAAAATALLVLLIPNSEA